MELFILCLLFKELDEIWATLLAQVNHTKTDNSSALKSMKKMVMMNTHLVIYLIIKIIMELVGNHEQTFKLVACKDPLLISYNAVHLGLSSFVAYLVGRRYCVFQSYLELKAKISQLNIRQGFPI